MNNNRSCLFFGFCLSSQLRSELITIDRSPAFQTLNFGDSLLELLSLTYSRVDSFSFSPINTYPTADRMVMHASSFYKADSKVTVLPFINLPIIRHFTRFFSLIFYFFLSRKEQKYDTIFIHGLHSPYIIFASFLKLFGYKVGVVVTDESGVVRDCDGLVIRFLKRIDSKIVVRLLGNFDFGLALSKDLEGKYFKNITSLVIPGIVNSRVLDLYSDKGQPSPYMQNDEFNVVYTGALEEEYGVKKLVDSFCRMTNKYVLHVFGSGTLSDYIKMNQVLHPNVKFYGFKSTEEISKYVVNCDLLVNPRPADSVMAKMSFPSKLLEYSLSGKPILTTRIKSIPDEIENGFLYINEQEVDGIINAVNFSSSEDVDADIGMSLKIKVLENYSVKSISKKIKSIL